MKSIKLIFAFLILFVIACEDPIDVPVEQSDAQIAVDAFINNKAEVQTISINETRPIFQADPGGTIEDAEIVVINNNSGLTMPFLHVGDGNYEYDPVANGAVGDFGDSFTLNITRSGAQYSASSILNPVPPIDSITQEFRTDEIFGPDGIYCQFFARDLPGIGNAYWIKTTKNDTFLNRPFEINLAFDAGFTAGSELDDIIFIPPIRELVNPLNNDGLPIVWNPGDRIEVEIHSLTHEAFGFMEIMRDQLINGQNGIFAEPIANAPGNIVNESGDEKILGIFNVSGVASLDKTIE